MAIAVFLVTLGPAHAFAQGGPPLLTDDPGTPGNGNWEINLAFTVDKQGRETSYETPLLDINYGLGERIQLKLEIPWIVLSPEGGGNTNGLGHSLIGVKWRFLDEKDAGFSASIYPQIDFNNPGSSSAERGLVEKGTSFLLPLEVAKEFGPFSAGTEIGYLFTDSQADEWIYGLAAGYAVNDLLELLAEIYGTASSDFEEQGMVFNVGFRGKLSETCTLLTSAGRGIYDSGGPETQFIMYLGMQFTF